ncbi:hypothetical protein FQN57_002911 [Myotisia sp. PD_48]|nr:hypothetical protein FQN57_002911 [Myotisia sp. PD_48]
MIKRTLLPIFLASSAAALQFQWTATTYPKFDIGSEISVDCKLYLNIVQGRDLGPETCGFMMSSFEISSSRLKEMNGGEINSKCTNIEERHSYCMAAAPNDGVARLAGESKPSTVLLSTGESPTTSSLPPGETSITACLSPDQTPSTISLFPGETDRPRSDRRPRGNKPTGDSLCQQSYVVKKGDTCYSIADKHGISVSAFRQLNLMMNCNFLKIGTTLCVKRKGITRALRDVQDTNAPPSPLKSGTNPNCSNYYKVKKGDTCLGVAVRAGISIAKLIQLNPAVGRTCEKMKIDYYVCVRA